MRVLLGFLALSLVLFPLTSAHAVYKQNGHTPSDFRGEGKTPLCDDPSVLKTITKRFHKTNVKYKASDLAFTEIERIRETEFLKNPANRNDRRYCAAHVHLSNGTHPTLYYLIQERYGLASLKSGVSFCVIGHDELRAHGANCRSVRKPF